MICCTISASQTVKERSTADRREELQAQDWVVQGGLDTLDKEYLS